VEVVAQSFARPHMRGRPKGSHVRELESATLMGKPQHTAQYSLVLIVDTLFLLYMPARPHVKVCSHHFTLISQQPATP
jgi:hypothetical protein